MDIRACIDHNESMDKKPTPAAIYARLSVDDGTRESTERQVADCRAYAEQHGLDVATEYVDRDTSAYRRVVRPQWDAMREAVERGEVRAVVAWKIDRLCRRIRDFAEFYELLETVWDFKSQGRTRTLDSHASRLRQKLGAVSDRPWIVNVWGHGYRVTAPE